MKASLQDIKNSPEKILEAINRDECVTLSDKGREVARIIPSHPQKKRRDVTSHPAFGMWKDMPESENPQEMVRRLRKGRWSAI